MSRIFISHNSNDAREAAALKRWLADNGWEDVFLDIDARDGLSPGERWKDALKTAADRCEAVLCLISPTWLASPECKLEYRYAETLRKHLFLALIKPCDPAELPPDWQWCLLYGEGAQTTVHFDFIEQPAECSFRSDGLERLKIGLQKAGISAKDFPWPPKKYPDRAPYRGLSPLEGVDAAVFFGRDAQILHGMEALWDMRRNGIERLLVILGASGSGKSSFMRAGLLPRLERDDRQFFPLPVIRPRNAVLFGDEGLAPALAAAFGQLGRSLAPGEVERQLKNGRQAFEALLAELEKLLIERILDDGEPQGPGIVIPIDQAEELFNPDGAAEAETFLALLGGQLAEADGQEPPTSTGSPKRAIVVLTIRSDRYERLQTAPGLSGVKPRLFDLRPFPPGQFERVINGPAERATKAGRKLTIDSRLTDRLLADFSEGADTLPLLGFALEKLYLKYGGSGELTLEDYEAIRGGHDTVQAAIFQEAIDTALLNPPRPPAIPAERTLQYQGLRRAFIPFMARINPENNEPMRQVAKLQDLPADVLPLVERLVEARLLIRDRDAIEVAHESLLRQWPSLRGWLAEDLDKLRLLHNIRNSAAEWKKQNQRDDLLVHRDGRLKDAEALLATPGYVVAADSDERNYLNACTVAQQAREVAAREAQEQRIRDAERIAEGEKKTARNTRNGLVAALVLATLAIITAIYAYHERHVSLQALAKADYGEASGKINLLKPRWGAYESLLSLVHALRIDAANLPSQGLLIDLLERRNWPLPLTEPLRHESWVFSAQFSPDGTRVVTASYDKTARVWDATTGKPLTKLSHDEVVTSAQFSPDDTRVVTASADNTARIWEAATGQPLTRPLSHDEPVNFAQFSPDGTRVATASDDHTARVWDANTGEALTKPLRHDGPVNSAQFSPDNTRVVTASDDHTARVWDATIIGTQARPLIELRHDGPVNSAKFSPDGKFVATASNDGTARTWDAKTGQALTEPLRHQWLVKSAQFSPDGTRVVTASWDNTAQVWDAKTGQRLTVLHHDWLVNSAQFSPDGTRVVTASADGSVRVWGREAAEGNPMTETLRLRHMGWVSSAQFNPDGTRVLVAATADKTARIWDVKTGQALTAETLRHEGPVNSARFSPDGTRVVTASDDNTARLWDAKTGKQLTEPLRHNEKVKFAQFSPDGMRVVTASYDKTARVWDAKTGQAQPQPLRHKDVVNSAQFSPDGKFVVTASADKTARIWNTRIGKTQTESSIELNHEDKVNSAQFSPDGKLVVTASDDKTARVWDAATGEAKTEPLRHEERVLFAKFSPDGARVVTASPDGYVRLWEWEAKTGRKPIELPHEHMLSIKSAQFSPDGTLVATASDDSTARVWDATTGQALTEPLRNESWVNSAQFSPDGTRVVTASDDNTARIWDVKTGKQLTEPLRHNEKVKFAQFSPDGMRVVTASDDKTAKIWDIPTLSTSDIENDDVELVALLAEAVAGYKINEKDLVVPVDDAVATLDKLRKQTASATQADSMGKRFVRWFLADRWDRTISPLSDITVQDYIRRSIAEQHREQAVVLFPGHPLLAKTDEENEAPNPAETKQPEPVVIPDAPGTDENESKPVQQVEKKATGKAEQSGLSKERDQSSQKKAHKSLKSVPAINRHSGSRRQPRAGGLITIEH